MAYPLEKIDILITIFNQEEIIERVLYGVLKNTTTSFNLILVFDGCTDRTKPRAEKYLKHVTSSFLREIIVRDTPNLFETRANNYGFKLSTCKYLITIQDDMVIREYGWERRLTLPLRKFNDVLAVSARSAQDVVEIGNGGKEKYANQAAFETNTLRRDVFAVRDVGIRGPLALRMDYLKELNYLNDAYAPCALDDTELSLRAWRDKRYKIGVFGINFLSKKEWSKVSAPDSTMKTWESWRRNLEQLYIDHGAYIDSGIKHTEDHMIPDNEIDYERGVLIRARKMWWIFLYPWWRVDKRRIKVMWGQISRNITTIIKAPLIWIFGMILGKKFVQDIQEQGIKGAMTFLLKK